MNPNHRRAAAAEARSFAMTMSRKRQGSIRIPANPPRGNTMWTIVSSREAAIQCPGPATPGAMAR